MISTDATAYSTAYTTTSTTRYRLCLYYQQCRFDGLCSAPTVVYDLLLLLSEICLLLPTAVGYLASWYHLPVFVVLLLQDVVVVVDLHLLYY